MNHNPDNSYFAGVDEAGRSPLAGPVMAAAVILPPRCRIKDLADSKKLTPQKREELYEIILARCLAYGVGRAEVHEIESLNIHYATLLAMSRAVTALTLQPAAVLIDGLHCPELDMPALAIPHGDENIPVISAASIIAKVSRDREMRQYHQQYPGYGFDCHKGYNTRQHRQALQKLGLTPLHRRTFATINEILQSN